MDPVTIGVIVSAGVTAVCGIVVAFIARSANRGNTTVEFAKAVVTRLEKVESDLDEVKGQLTKTQAALNAAVRFIDRLAEWGRTGAKGRMPIPPRDLHDYIDTTMWGVD